MGDRIAKGLPHELVCQKADLRGAKLECIVETGTSSPIAFTSPGMQEFSEIAKNVPLDKWLNRGGQLRQRCRVFRQRHKVR